VERAAEQGRHVLTFIFRERERMTRSCGVGEIALQARQSLGGSFGGLGGTVEPAGRENGDKKGRNPQAPLGRRGE